VDGSEIGEPSTQGTEESHRGKQEEHGRRSREQKRPPASRPAPIATTIKTAHATPIVIAAILLAARRAAAAPTLAPVSARSPRTRVRSGAPRCTIVARP